MMAGEFSQLEVNNFEKKSAQTFEYSLGREV